MDTFNSRKLLKIKCVYHYLLQFLTIKRRREVKVNSLKPVKQLMIKMAMECNDFFILFVEKYLLLLVF